MFGIWYVVREAAKKSDVDLYKNFKENSLVKGAKEMSVVQWGLLITGTVLCLISTWIDWNGSKFLAELKSKTYHL